MSEQEQHIKSLITELERDPETDADATAVTVLLAAQAALPALKALLAEIEYVNSASMKLHLQELNEGWTETLAENERLQRELSGFERRPSIMTEYITKKEFRALLDLFMCSDPWPLEDNARQTVEKFLDRTAQAYKLGTWVDAYHSAEIQ